MTEQELKAIKTNLLLHLQDAARSYIDGAVDMARVTSIILEIDRAAFRANKEILDQLLADVVHGIGEMDRQELFCEMRIKQRQA